LKEIVNAPTTRTATQVALIASRAP
jgi:hypothetical protein